MQHRCTSPPYAPLLGHFARPESINRNGTKRIPSNQWTPSLRHLRTVHSLQRFFARIAPLILAPLALTPAASAQALPDAPSALLATSLPHTFPSPSTSESHLFADPEPYSSSVTDATLETDPDLDPYADPQTNSQTSASSSTTTPSDKSQSKITANTGTQPHRILGLMPNYRTVSAGEIPPPPGFKQSFKIATRQAFDYSSFVFLGITTAAAYWQDSHPALDTYHGGNAPFWAYLWRGFLDKTDGNYQSAWILPTLLHEDTRYYAVGRGPKWKRLGYAMSRVAVARTYEGHSTPNLAGLGGKVGAQAVSTTYYPPGSEEFGVLATKFAYSIARDMGFTVFREFYPDIAIHVLHRNP